MPNKASIRESRNVLWMKRMNFQPPERIRYNKVDSIVVHMKKHNTTVSLMSSEHGSDDGGVNAPPIQLRRARAENQQVRFKAQQADQQENQSQTKAETKEESKSDDDYDNEEKKSDNDRSNQGGKKQQKETSNSFSSDEKTKKQAKPPSESIKTRQNFIIGQPWHTPGTKPPLKEIDQPDEKDEVSTLRGYASIVDGEFETPPHKARKGEERG